MTNIPNFPNFLIFPLFGDDSVTLNYHCNYNAKVVLCDFICWIPFSKRPQYITSLPILATMLSYTGTMQCFTELKFESSKPTNVVIYSHSGSKTIQHLSKVCPKKICRAHYHYQHFTKKNTFFSKKRAWQSFSTMTRQRKHIFFHQTQRALRNPFSITTSQTCSYVHNTLFTKKQLPSISMHLLDLSH